MKKKFLFISVLVIAVLVITISGCKTGTPPEEPPEEPVEEEKIEAPAPEPEPDKPVLPASPPMLSIETEMHSAPINSFDIDKDYSILVSVSDDKTIRVWDGKTRKMTDILRPFSQSGSEGRLYSVAITPNGEIIACGGWTKGETDTYNIYIFNRENGMLVHRIDGIPNVINHLKFSANGQFLAAALGGNSGLRLYNVSTFTEIANDLNYGGSSYWLDFDPQNRLVSSSYDGNIRLYDIANSDIITENKSESVNLVPAFKVKTTDGKHPFAVSFSPDGSRVAISYSDTPAINVYSGENLKLMYSPITSRSENGAYGIAVWSPDGQYLYAGGKNAIDGLLPIIRWADMGRGDRQDWPVTRDTIMQVMGLPDGGAIYASADPEIGILSSTGEKIHMQSSELPTFRGSRNALLLSPDGKIVQFGYQYGGTDKMQFSVDELQLSNPVLESMPTDEETRADEDAKEVDEVNDVDESESTQSVISFVAPDNQSLKVDGWKNGLSPQYNGIALKLKANERSRSLAIAPDRTGFILGTQWQLRHYNNNGEEVWNIPVPGEAWAVNISGDGKLAVAALGDGTIRWYDMSDGTMLLSLFPHRDKTRWVLWTPEGNYASSPGADDLIGWRVNNGPDAVADFFPVSQFSDEYNKPEEAKAVLNNL